ncbi:hypothetical protein J1N35_017429 [Gossypium stocksii]|uniref:RNase H type-1 domain-containing protein n=1 Tax=Gossypium stocksii TaxID=47602 RepID=A0A9D4A415_9ROSI|nr:hypothetical protein J1N35_017429 [Gossypium stocksii]
MSTNDSNASIGGVFRYHDVNSLCGYSMTISRDTIFKIETRSVLEGLCVAWEKNFRKIELECDNTLLVESLLAGGAANSKLTEL